MYKDLYKNNSFNVKTAKVFGLKAAVYWNELAKIAMENTTFDEEAFFTVDREYIADQTSLFEEEQLECDNMLSIAGVLTKSADDKNTIAIHTKEMVSIITSENLALLKDIAKAVRRETTEEKKNRKKNVILYNMQKHATSLDEDPKMQKLLEEWIEALFLNNKKLTNGVIDTFYKTVTNYSTDPITRYSVVKTATIRLYVDATWAINAFIKDSKENKANGVTNMSNTVQKAATQLNNNIKF